MNTLNIFYKLKNAFECSTQNNNLFEKALKSIKWDKQFYADSEHYFCLGKFTFTTPSLDQFNIDWKPSALFTDNSYIEF